jgi:hypothetical protein
MWWMPEGQRILQGAEAGLFREALGTIVHMARDDDEGLWQFDAPPFDGLRPNQKLAVLAQVGSALYTLRNATSTLYARRHLVVLHIFALDRTRRFRRVLDKPKIPTNYAIPGNWKRQASVRHPSTTMQISREICRFWTCVVQQAGDTAENSIHAPTVAFAFVPQSRPAIRPRSR